MEADDSLHSFSRPKRLEGLCEVSLTSPDCGFLATSNFWGSGGT